MTNKEAYEQLLLALETDTTYSESLAYQALQYAATLKEIPRILDDAIQDSTVLLQASLRLIEDRVQSPVYVLGQDHISLYKKGATGLLISEEELLERYGSDVLDQIYAYRTAIRPDNPKEKVLSLMARIRPSKALLCRLAKVTEQELENVLDADVRSPVRHVERVLTALEHFAVLQDQSSP